MPDSCAYPKCATAPTYQASAWCPLDGGGFVYIYLCKKHADNISARDMLELTDYEVRQMSVEYTDDIELLPQDSSGSPSISFDESNVETRYE